MDPDRRAQQRPASLGGGAVLLGEAEDREQEAEGEGQLDQEL